MPIRSMHDLQMRSALLRCALMMHARVLDAGSVASGRRLMLGLCQSRHEVFQGYKAQRPPMPEGIKLAVPRIKEILATMGIPNLSVPGVEADDTIGSVATRAVEEGFAVAVASPDKVDCSRQPHVSPFFGFLMKRVSGTIQQKPPPSTGLRKIQPISQRLTCTGASFSIGGLGLSWAI